jgi:hypothetical protein
LQEAEGRGGVGGERGVAEEEGEGEGGGMVRTEGGGGWRGLPPPGWVEGVKNRVTR